jgi:PAS domain S-box-containing protein
MPLNVLLTALVIGLVTLAALRLRRVPGAATDAEARVEVEHTSVREAGELWRKVFEFAPDGYILLGLDGRLVSMNRAACELSGVARENGEGQFIFELGILDDEGLAQAARNLGSLQQGADPGPAEYTFHRGDGSQRRVEIIGHLLEEAGRTLMLTIIHDVTERRRTEDELRRNRVRLEEAQRVAGLVTWDFDLNAGTMWVSDSPAVDTGSGKGMTLGLADAMTYVHPDDRDRVAASIAAGISGPPGHETATEYRQTDPLGRERIARTMSRTEVDEQGNVVRMIGATLDITDIREAEKEIRVLNTELEERVRQRTRELEQAIGELEAFSYSVSHDLRSPLRAMAGYSQMVLDDPGNSIVPESREYLERIRVSSVRMAAMIDDLLSLSRLTRATRRDERVNLSELAAVVAQELRQSDPRRQVEVRIQEDILVDGDAGMLRLVLQNLFGNAWKFTRDVAAPAIELGCDASGTCFVRDNGVGFDPAQSAKLFRPFERLHRTDEFEGTGIGLATVERIIRHHGGEVRADGEIGRGSTFWFTLPKAAAEEQALAG